MALRRLMKAAFVLFAAACATIAVRGFSAAPSDCRIVVDGVVYDVTPYLSRHPAPPGLIEPWCGRDASAAWADKGIGRPHSPAARALLETFRSGARR